jgi:hypothetical protein
MISGPKQPFQDFILVGGSTEKKISLNKRYVEAEVEVPKPINGNSIPYALLKDLKATKRSNRSSATLLKTMSCLTEEKR